MLSKTGTAFVEPGSPWQTPFVESFHARVRDELLDVEEFSCLAEARLVIDDCREDYNDRRPLSALGMKAPTVFAASLYERSSRQDTNCSLGKSKETLSGSGADVTLVA